MKARCATRQECALLARARTAWRDYMFPGGLPAKRRARPADFDQNQLAIGVKVELEHTRRPDVALEIAMAHLIEDPAYYAKLEAAGL